MQAGQPYQRRARAWLLALLLASFALSLWYGLATPLGEGPDEPAHLDYVLFMAREGRLPSADAGLAHPGEAHQPPLAYLAALPLVAWLPDAELHIRLGENPRWSWSGGTEPAAYFRRTAELIAPHGVTLAWRLVRVLSALLGSLTVGLTYLLARRLDYREATALGAAGLVAFLPQFAFQHGLVSNDPLLWMLSTATLVWLAPGSLQRETQGRGPRNESVWAIGLGILLGTALLTKASALILLPVAALGLWLRARQGLLRRPWQAAALALAAMLALSGWWFWDNLRQTGDPWGVAEFRRNFATAPFDPGDPQHWASAARALGTSLVARFGWANLPAPPPVYWLATAIAGMGALGLLLHMLRGARPTPWAYLLALLALLTLGWVVAFALTVGQVAGQGRFLFPALPVLAVALAQGLAQLRPRSLPLPAAVIALLLTAALLPATTIRPAYRWLVVEPQPQAPAQGRFAGAGEPGIELREAGFPPSAQAGETLPVNLLWHVIGRPKRNWTVFVHLARPGKEEPAVAANALPLAGSFPMLAWTSGDWIRDPHPIAVPAALEPGIYALRVGLFDPQTDWRRARVYIGDKPPEDYVNLGLVRIEQAQ